MYSSDRHQLAMKRVLGDAIYKALVDARTNRTTIHQMACMKVFREAIDLYNADVRILREAENDLREGQFRYTDRGDE